MANSKRSGQTVRLAIILLAGGSLAACASVQPRYPSQGPSASNKPGATAAVRKVGKPYEVGGVWYVPQEDPNYDRRGVASWYGDAFHMKATANGEIFDMNAVSAAHTTLPLPSMVEVTNLDNGRKLVVRVNDRGPFVDNRLIDLSREAAVQLGFDRQGLANVRVRYVGPAPLLGPADGLRYASAKPLPTRAAAIPATAAPLAASSDALMEIASGAPAPRAAMARSEPIGAQSLPPVTGSEISRGPLGPLPSGQPVVMAQATATPGLRIQAAAFSSQVNAQRAVAQLSGAGAASIETIERDGMMLYRVVMPAPADEAAAYALRDRVAEIGFTDARVVRLY
ncbi:septal ring lytic transglycosylase RlpA family protein [Phenylobacterium sp.]|uniref:septal ring lytic transglycosylase RlpA family protein n=1 Tax=Phenylobacterium sp. TaxID=1871053 RepID=UPI003D2D08CA